jgi:hypothetical protein
MHTSNGLSIIKQKWNNMQLVGLELLMLCQRVTICKCIAKYQIS